MARLPSELETKISPFVNTLMHFNLSSVYDSTLSGFSTELMQIIPKTLSLLLIIKEGNSPKEYQVEILKLATRVDNLIKRIQNYLSEDNISSEMYDEITNEIRSTYIIISSQESEIGKIAYNLQQYEMLTARREIKEKIEEINHYKKILSEKQNKADTILHSLQKESANKFAEEFANVFLEQANKHSFRWKGIAQRWLFTGIAMIIALVVIIFIPHFIPFHKAESIVSMIFGFNYSLVGITQRLVIISILIFVIRLSFRHYGINKHLYTLNIHRQNVMNTYRHFEHSLSDRDIEIRNVLLAELTRSIFSQENTGYLHGSKDDSIKLKDLNYRKFRE